MRNYNKLCGKITQVSRSINKEGNWEHLATDDRTSLVNLYLRHLHLSFKEISQNTAERL